MKNFSISRLAGIIISQRKLRKMTQQELAEKAGINRSMLCRMENQDYVPSLDQLTRIANALSFDVSDVFIEYNPPVFHHIVPQSIAVYGSDSIGLSIATLLARHHEVTLVDTDPEKVRMINQRISPIKDEYIEKHFSKADLHLTASSDTAPAFTGKDYIIITQQAYYEKKTDVCDLSLIETAVETILHNDPNAVIVIRSVIPVGCTSRLQAKHKTNNIMVSPDFSRENKAFYDNLYPDRIIVGCDPSVAGQAQVFAHMLRDSTLKKDTEIQLMGLAEAEAVKLFSDTYDVLRTSFINELDTYAESNGLNPKTIIQGIHPDWRDVSHGNNPSFGFDESVLKKRYRLLFENMNQAPQEIIPTIVDSSRTRKEYIADHVLEIAGIDRDPDFWNKVKEKRIVIGAFRLTSVSDPDGVRSSSVWSIIKRIKAEGITVMIYEPLLEDGTSFFGSRVINDLRKFKKLSTVIISDCYDPVLDDVMAKVYTRNLFH